MELLSIRQHGKYGLHPIFSRLQSLGGLQAPGDGHGRKKRRRGAGRLLNFLGGHDQPFWLLSELPSFVEIRGTHCLWSFSIITRMLQPEVQ
jgi:hypothetical protein